MLRFAIIKEAAEEKATWIVVYAELFSPPPASGYVVSTLMLS